MSKVEQSVITGGLYTIEPSDSFMGIEPGIVEVLQIAISTESNYKQDIGEYITTSISDEEVITRDTLWVAYMYTSSDDEEVYVLPIEVFKEHTTAYIPD